MPRVASKSLPYYREIYKNIYISYISRETLLDISYTEICFRLFIITFPAIEVLFFEITICDRVDVNIIKYKLMLFYERDILQMEQKNQFIVTYF